MLMGGRGGELDEAGAFYWRSQAAAQGDPAGQFQLAYHLLLGIGCAKEPSFAAFWLRLSAEQGYRTAQVALGGLYRRGYGVPVDLDESLSWYEKAARQGRSGSACSDNLF
jgi:TPR repeat protein